MSKIVQVARFTADGEQVKRTFTEIGQAGQATSEKLKQSGPAMSAPLKALDEAAHQARGKIEELAHHSGGLGQILLQFGPMGLAAAVGIGAVTLAFHALQEKTKEAVKSLGEIEHSSARLGISTQSLQEWRFAGAGVGLEAQSMDTALSKLNLTIGAMNTEIGKKGKLAFEALGFTPEQLRTLGSVDEVLPELADRISKLGSAAAQARIAQQLGLTDILPLLREGSDALERARARAEEMGAVLDEDLIRRAAELNGEWSQANYILDVQLKATLVELAPAFITVAEAMAKAAKELRGFIDNFVELGHKSDDSLHRRLVELSEDMKRLDDQTHGRVSGGDDPDPADALAQRYRSDFHEMQRIQEILRGRHVGEGADNGIATTDFTADRVDERVKQLRSFVDGMRAENLQLERLQELTEQYPKAANGEIQARLKLQQQIAQLTQFRVDGTIATEGELNALKAVAAAGYDAAASVRAQAAAEQARTAQVNAIAAIRQQVETPQEKLAREENLLRKQYAVYGDALGSDTFQRRLAQIRQEYERLADAQSEASLQGQILSGVMNGQIKNFHDLEAAIVHLVANAAMQELLHNGGVSSAGGGIGGFFQRVLGDVLTGGKGGGGSNPLASIFASVVGAVTGGGISPSHISKLSPNNLPSAFTTPPFLPGPGRAGGGDLWPRFAHPVAEHGPELAVVGGWGHVLPNETFDGLRLLASLAKGAASGAGGGLQVNVNVQKEDGLSVEVGRATPNASGGIDLPVIVRRAVASEIGRGNLDRSMSGRFGVTPQRIPR